MSRTRQLATAMGLLVAAAFACAAIIHLLIAPRLSTLFNLKAPTDALLTLDDVGPGFEMRNEFTSSIGVETEVNRHFDATGEASDSDALSIESSAAAYRLAMEDPDDYINLRLGTVAFFTRGNRSIVSVEGPSMGGPTAWRASLDPDAEDPIDWTIVAFRRANTWIMISVEGFRGDVTPADVAALASKVAVRLDAGTPPSNGVSEGPSRPPTAPKPG